MTAAGVPVEVRIERIKAHYAAISLAERKALVAWGPLTPVCVRAGMPTIEAKNACSAQYYRHMHPPKVYYELCRDGQPRYCAAFPSRHFPPSGTQKLDLLQRFVTEAPDVASEILAKHPFFQQS